MARGDRRPRKSQRSVTMGELQNILANMPEKQRRMLLGMFPEPKEPRKQPEKVTRRELLAMWDALETTLDLPSRAPEFAYAIVQNRAKMRVEIKKLNKAKEPSDAYVAFDAERLALCALFANKDAQGNVVHDGERYDIPDEKRPLFDFNANEIRERHAEAIEAYKLQASNYDKLLDGEVPCPEFVLIPLRALPGSMTARQLEPLQSMLE